jgi:transcriptional regulator with XRE-family HTH domain
LGICQPYCVDYFSYWGVLFVMGEIRVNLNAVRFHDKVRLRVSELGINRAKAARDVGLPVSTISNYMSKLESLPRADIAFKIAKAIAVPIEWLLDDEQDFPPPSNTGTTSLKYATDAELIEEVETRYQRAAVALRDTLDQLKAIDLGKLAKEIAATPPGSPLSKTAETAVKLFDRYARHKCEVVDLIALGSTTGGPAPHPRYRPEQLSFAALNQLEDDVCRRRDYNDFEHAIECRETLGRGSASNDIKRSSAAWIDRFLGRSRA